MFVSGKNVATILAVCLVLIAVFVKANDDRAAYLKTAGTDVMVKTFYKLTADSAFFDTASKAVMTNQERRTSVAYEAPRDPITAEAYIAGNLNTGKIYISKNVNKQLPIASISKLMTGIIAFERLSGEENIQFTEEMLRNYPDLLNFQPGEKIKSGELIYSMLLNSSNISAYLIASSTGLIDFLENMSARAWELGMNSTYFADPTGLSEKNMSSVHDLFIFMKYLYNEESAILSITRTPTYSLASTTDHGAHDFTNIHPFVREVGFIGGKTGNTPQAGGTLVTLIRVNGEPIGIAVLGSSGPQARADDTRLIIERIKKLLP